MTWGAHGAQHPSPDNIRWRPVTKRDNGHLGITAVQGGERAGIRWRPQQDSNLRSRLRRPLLSPLSYGGCATPKGTSRKPRANTSWPAVSGAAPPSRHVAAIGEAPAETSYFQRSREFSKNGIAIRRTFIFESDNEFRG